MPTLYKRWAALRLDDSVHVKPDEVTHTAERGLEFAIRRTKTTGPGSRPHAVWELTTHTTQPRGRLGHPRGRAQTYKFIGVVSFVRVVWKWVLCVCCVLWFAGRMSVLCMVALSLGSSAQVRNHSLCSAGVLYMRW